MESPSGVSKSIDLHCVTVGYYVLFLSFVVVTYVPNALWLRRTLVSLS